MTTRRHTRTATAAALVAVLPLAACAISEEPADGDGSTLTIWSYYTGAQAEWLDEQVAAFEEANDGVTIEIVETVGDQQAQRLLSAAATGSTPDLFINNIVVDYPTLVGGGVMLDITEQWDAYADRDQYPDGTAWTTDDRAYNLLPFTNLIGLYANTDILADVGIAEIPTTLDELDAALEAVAADGQHQGIALSGAPTVEGAWLFAPQLLGEGIDYCSFDGEPVDAAFDRVAGWAQAGSLPQGAATWDQTDAWQEFATGDYAFGINGNWNLGNALELPFGYETAQYPAPTDGSSVVYPGGEGWAIGADTEQPELAWQFLEEAVLSADASERIYEIAGSIPVRADAAAIPAIADDPLVQPFVEAAQTSGSWPDNENTAAVQAALGEAISGVISGQTTAEQGSTAAVADIAAALEEGGGTC